MGLGVTCYYCGARKDVQSGGQVKLTCDQCVSSKIILDRNATLKCMLCRKIFRLAAGKQVTAFHNEPDCLGLSLVLLDYD